MRTADRYRELRTGYYRRLEIGVGVALALHVLVFALAPPYVPRPFRLRQDEPLRLVVAGLPFLSTAPVPGPPAPRAPEMPRAVAPPSPSAFVKSEQLEPAPARSPAPPAATPAPTAAAGAGSGAAESDTPPVFYEYDTAPRIVKRVEPEYPLAARAAGAQGTVIIDVNVDETGRLLRAWVAQATAPEALVQAALDAVYQFEFSPGKMGAHPVTCTVAIPFHFTLTKT
jgi:protein TonB